MAITGTKEWAVKNINIGQGCEHGCRYCYSRYNSVTRFKQCSAEQFISGTALNTEKIDGSFPKYDGIVMYPSQHDITPSILSEYLVVLRKLLEAGNKVLIVTKPHLDCIKVITESYEEFRRQIMFRFTIGSMDDGVLKFWEPNAPHFKERWQALKYAFCKGYKTSVSAEPYLDNQTKHLYEFLRMWVNESFWIGKLNDFKNRVDLKDVTKDQVAVYVKPLLKAQSDKAVLKLYDQLKGQPFIQWKDSIREIIKKTY